MMILDLFRKKKSALFFQTGEWLFDKDKRIYGLQLDATKIKTKTNSKIYLYRRQGERYFFMSDGYETINGNNLIYYSQFPFDGKIIVK